MHDHLTHDLTLIAGLAAGDLSVPDRIRAHALLDACTECTTIHADLLAIAAATRALPKRATAPQDFRLSDDQAARLRRRSWLRAFLTPFATARSATRTMATAFTSLGLAGLLVVAVLPGLLGSAASMAPEREQTTGVTAGAAPTAAPALPVDAAAASAVPGPEGPRGAIDSTASGAPGAAFGAKNTTPTGTPGAAGQESGSRARLAQPAPTNLLLLGSLVLLVIGLTLFGLRFAARRLNSR